MIAGTKESIGHSLTYGQLARIIAVGVVFWFGAAMAVKVLSPMGAFGTVGSAVMFALALPLGWAGVWIAARVASLRGEQVLPGIAVGAAAATFCDGIALTWFRWLYGTDPEQVLYGAAWILWGIFAFIVAAIVEGQRTRN